MFEAVPELRCVSELEPKLSSVRIGGGIEASSVVPNVPNVPKTYLLGKYWSS